mmetsp:Transcript_27219/g.51575  ORF Transcript_27219/g.51575 Transcript_27219/m.51575 type:complete len:316 (-) Transcript_27219:118-1065(-)
MSIMSPSKRTKNHSVSRFVKSTTRLLVILYISLLLIILFTPPSSTTSVVHSFLNLRLPPDYVDKTYSLDCPPLSLDNLDIFFVSHLIGYTVLSFIIPSTLLTQTISVLFELIELSLKPWLPNFQECLYDSLFLDVILCNTSGIILGHFLRKKYLPKITFNPFLNLSKSLCIITSTLISLTNGFTLKTLLKLPPSHYSFPLRTLIVALQLHYFLKELTLNTELSTWRKSTFLTKLSPSSLLFSSPMIDVGLILFIVEAAVISRHGLCTGLFKVEELNVVAVGYLSFLGATFIGSTCIVREDVGGRGGMIRVVGKYD